MKDQLEQSYRGFKEKLPRATNEVLLQELKAHYLGKNGEVTQILKGLGQASPAEKKEIGPLANEIKQKINEDFRCALEEIGRKKIEWELENQRYDISARESLFVGHWAQGSLHPVTIVQREIEDIFLSMGFAVLDGPHVEDDYHNFTALNIAEDHPARDMQDTFWFANSTTHLLRTHTSTIQVRGMATHRPPFQFIAPGKVFRAERTDASHEMVFHQLEGMMVGEDISVAHLIYFMKTALSEIFGKKVEVRLRPGYFPFVEPGFELDIACLICHGKGCSVCKKSGWVELLPCGMVHPNVLSAGGIDPQKYSGFAFGLGLDRLVMMRYGIDDIRYLHAADLRFQRQFSQF